MRGSGPRMTVLGGAYLAEELCDLIAQLLALDFQRLRSDLHIISGCRSGIRVGFHTGDVVGDVLGAMRRLMGIARDLLRRRTLLLDRGGDGGCDLTDLADDAADALDRIDGFACHLLD